MAILKIVKEGDPVLHKVCRPVDTITPRIKRLIGDMIDTMHDANGVGLAAPQVGVLRRIVVIEVEEGETIVLVNPEIISAEGSQHELEGCLSIPGKWGITERPNKVTVKALDRNGKEVTYNGEDLLAKAFCHEIDHLDGILFTDKAVIHMLTDEEMRELTEEE